MAFFSAKDISGKNDFMPPKMMLGTETEQIFADTLILFHNQPVGVIVAETMELANHAANFIEITYKHQGTNI